jgi:hypothetical protein
MPPHLPHLLWVDLLGCLVRRRKRLSLQLQMEEVAGQYLPSTQVHQRTNPASSSSLTSALLNSCSKSYGRKKFPANQCLELLSSQTFSLLTTWSK